MKKRTNKHTKRAGGRGRGRPALSGNVQIEPIHVSRLDLTKLAHALERYWNCLSSVDKAKLLAK